MSCGIGRPYQEDFVVTKRNCDLYCSDAWHLYYSDYPRGCPTQEESQYAFKIHAVSEAIRAGFRYILWMDSSLSPIAPVDPLWELISQQGWYAAPQFNGIMMKGDWRCWASDKEATLAEWCSDTALSVFGLTRAQARDIPIVLTGLIGLDMGNPLAVHIWQLHRTFFTLGVFNGPHANNPGKPVVAVGRKLAGHVSSDQKVLGHRHDETSFSFILHSLGLKATKRGFLTLEDERGFIAQYADRLGIRYKGAPA